MSVLMNKKKRDVIDINPLSWGDAISQNWGEFCAISGCLPTEKTQGIWFDDHGKAQEYIKRISPFIIFKR